MKKLIFTTMLITAILSVYATNVSGPISTNTTWTLANSPYQVTGNIVLMPGNTLTIEPGVQVKFNAGLSIQIRGKLLAVGTPTQKITFTSNTTLTPGAWGYIYFDDVSTDAVYDVNGDYVSGSIMQYCIIEYAGGATVTDNGALRLDGAHPFVDHCNISNNSSRGINAWNLTSKLQIKYSNITHNIVTGSGGGICVEGIGTVIISHNTISNNIATSGTGGGINASSTTTISNNTISNNSASGLNFGGGGGIKGGGTIYNNIIINNSATDMTNGGGGGI
ncbi:MAG: right-handed parallel beta-helix repeat-containing protein [Bacteroidales bacterium]|nr:right-handed parallel beta-helix repeat-containing protein [Bacteroidales bacterium]